MIEEANTNEEKKLMRFIITEKTVEIEFTVDKETDNNITMVISMGKIENVDTPVSGITLSDFKLIKVK